MPSADVKQETMASNETVDPFQKAITYLKFKIKNMDQRKKNLEAIQEKLDAGLEKELEIAQVHAASKLPEVSSNISFLEQTLNRLQTHHDEHAKQERARKQQAKLERVQQDLERLRRVLVIQDVLNNIDERVRADLLAGQRGAPQLTEAGLEQLDNIFRLVTPSRDDEDVPIKDQMATAAEHLLRLADRSQKKVAGTTYENVTKQLEAIFESGVLSPAPAAAENGLDGAEHAEEPAPAAAADEAEPAEAAPVAAEAAPAAEEAAPAEEEPAALLVPGPAPGSAGDTPPYPQQVMLAPSQLHQQLPAAAPAMVPVPVPLPVPVPQQPSINFLQESELLRADPAVMDPAVVRFSPAAPGDYHSIPSQTFTNTNFAGLPVTASLSEYVAAGVVYPSAGGVVDTTPNPPPPIPLPNHEPAPPPTPAAAPAASAPPVPEPAPAETNAWATRQAAAPAAAAAPAPAPAVPAAAAESAPAPAAAGSGSGAAWGDGEGDTEIGQWDGGSAKAWDNGGKDAWENGGDNHWNGTDGRRGGYRGRGSGRSRGPSNGFGGRGRGGYERPPRTGRGGYGGGYGEERRERPEARRGAAGGERPYRGGRGGSGGGRGVPRGGRGGPVRQ